MLPLILIASFLAAGVCLELRAWHPTWWTRRWIRGGVVSLAVSAIAGALLRGLGQGQLWTDERSPAQTIAGAVLAGGGSVLLLGLLFALPAAAVLRAALRWFALRDPGEENFTGRREDGKTEKTEKTEGSEETEKEESLVPERGPLVFSRRNLVEAAVAAVPATAMGLGVTGIVGAFRETEIVARPMRFAGLPGDLEGLRVVQLTDLHLGAFMDPAGLAALVERVREAKPDLVLLTGDICDHLPWLDGALERVQSLDPRLGTFAVMGNHEHYRGARAARIAYARTRIELLDDRHQVLQVGDSRLVVLGVDDPIGSGRAPDHFIRRGEKALSGAPSDAFRLALCHRPSGFPALAAHGVDLTLSGHTHGAQIGDGERSRLEGLVPSSYLWGRYQHEGKQLYTSSGGGHWFAFRLDCPSEAALITLERA